MEGKWCQNCLVLPPLVSVLKIREDTEKYKKEVAGADWRKLITVAV